MSSNLFRSKRSFTQRYYSTERDVGDLKKRPTPTRISETTVAALSTSVLDTVGTQYQAIPAYSQANSPTAYSNTDWTIATGGTITYLDWDGVDDATWGSWSAGANTLLTAPITGRYIAIFSAYFTGNSTGNRLATIVRESDGSTLSSVQMAATTTASWRANVSTPVFTLNVGDSVKAGVNQTSGGNLVAQSAFMNLSLILLG